MGRLLTTPTQYKSLFPKSRENWLRSLVRWQMDSVALPETWNYRWHLICDNKEHPPSNQPLAFIFVMSSACRWLLGILNKILSIVKGLTWTIFISPSVWSPVWWAWTTAISISVLVYKKLSEGCLWFYLSCSVLCLEKNLEANKRVQIMSFINCNISTFRAKFMQFVKI